MSHKLEYLRVREALDFRPSVSRYAFELSIQLLLLVAMLSFSFDNLLSWSISQIVFATWVFRNFALMHEAVHGALAKHRGANRLLGRVHALLCFLPYESWRSIHIEHHKWAGNIDRDPTMRIVKNLATAPQSYREFLNLTWKSRLPLLALLQNLVFWTYPFKREAELSTWDRIESLICALLFASLLLSSFYLPFAGFLPGLILYLGFVESFNFPHHIQVAYVKGETKLDPSYQAEVSRTCRYHPLVERVLLLNFNFHGEHHIYPRLPWHELPRAADLIQASGLAIERTRVSPADGAEWMRLARRQNFVDLFEVNSNRISPDKAA